MIKRLSRVPEGNVQGIQYNGQNIGEVIDFYIPLKDRVTIFAERKTIIYRKHIIEVGDWVVNDAGMKRIVPKKDFPSLYAETDTPRGYKRVDVYGNDV